MGFAKGGDGYGWNPEDLKQVSTKFHDAATSLDAAAKALPEVLDLGASSQQVAKELSTHRTWMVTGAQHADDIADKVHATRGSYGQVEADNTDVFDHHPGTALDGEHARMRERYKANH